MTRWKLDWVGNEESQSSDVFSLWSESCSDAVKRTSVVLGLQEGHCDGFVNYSGHGTIKCREDK